MGGVNPKSIKNLKSFKKGCKGGPGRPKGLVPFKTVLERFLDVSRYVEKHPETGKPGEITVQEQVVVKLISKAINGDMNAIKEVLERVDGKAAQLHEHSGKDGEPIKHTHDVAEVKDTLQKIINLVVN